MPRKARVAIPETKALRARWPGGYGASSPTPSFAAFSRNWATSFA